MKQETSDESVAQISAAGKGRRAFQWDSTAQTGYSWGRRLRSQTGEGGGGRSPVSDGGKCKIPVQEAVASVKLELEGRVRDEKRHLHIRGI